LLEQLGIFDRGLPQPQTQTEGISPEASLIDPEDTPLDLMATDELSGDGIPADDLPLETVAGPPDEPLPEETVGSPNDPSEPSRPIFFPKETEKIGTSDQASEADEYTPEPFTIEELREISESPLGVDDQIDANDQVDASFEEAAETTSGGTKDRQPDGRSEISALVERISNFQRSREQTARPIRSPDGALADSNSLMPRLPLGEEDDAHVRIVRGFAFAADAGGRIEWAEEDIAPMIVGTRIVSPARQQLGGTRDPLAFAFTQRQPLKAAPFSMRGAPAIAGDWIIDAQPRFSQIGGFSGYIGRMRRPIEAAASGPGPAEREADRIRQLLHELRTPVTAVQGYSEVIQQQLFGSASHEYRALAAAIASDAARILAGFEEL
ncbi:MAG: histidine kinase dimerization/phospho-acceptor domain-containing protein, partial [Pseudomonadota bacterium]